MIRNNAYIYAIQTSACFNIKIEENNIKIPKLKYIK